MGRKKNQIDYQIFVTLASPLMDSPILEPLKPQIGNRYVEGDTFNTAMMVAAEVSSLPSGPKDPFTRNDTKTVDDKSREKVNKNLDFLAGEYRNILDNENIKKYDAIHKYYEHVQRYITDAQNGIDRNAYMNSINGVQYCLSNPDWIASNKVTGFVATPEEMNGMLKDMRYPEFWDTANALCDLEIEMEGKSGEYSPEEKKQLSERIKELNNTLVSIYNHQRQPEMREKYNGKFFLDHADSIEQSHSIWGNRGAGKSIEAINKLNTALDNGWDPTRISDYLRIQRMCNDFAKEANQLEESNNPDLSALANQMKKVSELNPNGKKFANQEELFAYYDRFSKSVTAAIKESQKPGILEAYEDTLNSGALLSPHSHRNNGHLEVCEYFAERAAFAVPPAVRQTMQVAAFDDGVTDIRRQAKAQLEKFKNNLDNLQKNNSDYYKNMRSALETVANLPADVSLNEVNAAMDNLRAKSAEYVNKRKGIFKTGKGQARLDAADELIRFADNSKANLSEITQETIIARNPDTKSSKLDPSYQKKFGTVNEQEEPIPELEDALEAMDSPQNSNDKKFGLKVDVLAKAFTEISQKPNDQIKMVEMKYSGKDGAPQKFEFDEYIRSMSRLLAAKTLESKINRGEIDRQRAFNTVEINAMKLERDKTFMSMAKEARDNPAFRKELADLTPGELFAKLSVRKQNEKLKQAQGKKDRENEVVNKANKTNEIKM